MHHALGDALTVEVGQVVDQGEILHSKQQNARNPREKPVEFEQSVHFVTKKTVICQGYALSSYTVPLVLYVLAGR